MEQEIPHIQKIPCPNCSGKPLTGLSYCKMCENKQEVWAIFIKDGLHVLTIKAM
jgi:hypothetical protein